MVEDTKCGRNESKAWENKLSWQGWTVADIKVEPTGENVEAVNVALARLLSGA